jgi:quinohemoprotein ethanol dehydrogenase
VPAPPGGLLSTAGNLVLGGHADGDLNAWAADTGELLWSYFTERGILAPPISYAIDDKQYIAILAGWGGASGLGRGSDNPAVRNQESGRLLVFSLGANTPLPEQFDFELDPPVLPDLTASTEAIAEGEVLFGEYCGRCHSFAGGGAISNLIDMPTASHTGFKQIVRDGLWESAGMIGFGSMLTDSQIESIHQYIISAAMAERKANAP